MTGSGIGDNSDRIALHPKHELLGSLKSSYRYKRTGEGTSFPVPFCESTKTVVRFVVLCLKKLQKSNIYIFSPTTFSVIEMAGLLRHARCRVYTILTLLYVQQIAKTCRVQYGSD